MCDFIDYNKPIRSDLDEGDIAKKIIEIMQTEPLKYDIKKEAKQARENLRKQGLKL